MDGANGAQDKGSTENLGQPSALEKLTSGIEEGKQYTGAETLKLVQDALSADGREQKTRADTAEGNVTRLTGELNGLTTQITGLTTQIGEISKAQNDTAELAVKDDPAALTSLRARHAITTEDARLKGVAATQQARETAFATKEVTFAKKETSFNIKLAAMAAGVDAVKLEELVPDGDSARLVNAATLLKGTGSVEIDPITKLPKPVGLTNTPVATVSTGVETRSLSERMLQKAKEKA